MLDKHRLMEVVRLFGIMMQQRQSYPAGTHAGTPQAVASASGGIGRLPNGLLPNGCLAGGFPIAGA